MRVLLLETLVTQQYFRVADAGKANTVQGPRVPATLPGRNLYLHVIRGLDPGAFNSQLVWVLIIQYREAIYRPKYIVMYFERGKAQRPLYPNTHQKRLSSQLPLSRGRRSNDSSAFPPTLGDKRKRIMTQYDEEPAAYSRSIGRKKDISVPKSLFEKEISNIFKKIDRNPTVVQSSKNNESKNMYLKSVYGSLANKPIKRTRHQASVNETSNQHKQSVVLQSKERKKSLYIMTSKMSREFGELRRKSLSQCKSNTSKQGKPKDLNHKLTNLKIDHIHLQKKPFRQQNTFQTVKKEPEQPQKENKFNLSVEEQQTFGDRFPYGCDKVKLLGRGGFSLVWLGEHRKSGKLFAIKQIRTENNHQTHMKEIWFGSLFFTLGGLPRPEFSKHPGIKNLAKMYSYQINQLDTWIFYQKCGSSLGTCLYDIRSERYNGEKVYRIHPKPLYKAMTRNPAVLKKLIIQLCKGLELLSETQVVHSDLKTQNILIKHDQEDIHQVKLIDYGSSFSFNQINQFSMATPEYMSHEILNYILCENQSPYDEEVLDKVKAYRDPWVIDIWSLGCVILEIINGIPLWMSLPLLVDVDGRMTKAFGLFAVKGRGFQQIIDKQREVISNLDQVLLEMNYSGIKIDRPLLTVLRGMLEFQPEERMSPKRVIEILSQN